MSWYSSRWLRNGHSNDTPLPTVAPSTSTLAPLSATSPTAPAPNGNGISSATAITPGFAHLLPQNTTTPNDPSAAGTATRTDRKALEPLFGPNIGAVSSGPAWTSSVDRDKKVLAGSYTGLSSTDELTPEVINGWVEKSKDPSQPTTTLQALVNLKRPSIRLIPLSLPSHDLASSSSAFPTTTSPHTTQHQQHALEFTYDADCPKVSARVHVYLPRGHPDLDLPSGLSPSAAGSLGLSPVGGFSAGGYAVGGLSAGGYNQSQSQSHSTYGDYPQSTLVGTYTYPTAGPYGKLLVFETVTEGGFGKKLKLEDGAVVELGRFEKVPTMTMTKMRSGGSGGSGFGSGFGSASGSRGAPRFGLGTGEGTFVISEEPEQEGAVDGLPRLNNDGVTPTNPTSIGTPNASGGTTATHAASRKSHRFTKAFRFIKHHQHAEGGGPRAAGPALAVVDAHAGGDASGTTTAAATAAATSPSAATSTGTAATTATSKKQDEEGVKLTIRLVALDEQGTEMGCPNEQVTYLHVVRVGVKPAVAPSGAATNPANAMKATNATSPSTAPDGAGTSGGAKEDGETKKEEQEHQEEEEGEEEEEDTRPWLVKVVKREATIGPHTFHLHEIFGLTSSASETSPETLEDAVGHGHGHGQGHGNGQQQHTYPPTFGSGTVDSDDPQSECLLCLSSPREVVLLPCRHLVACKECALNMVEFGAGGVINQDPPPGGGAAAAAASAVSPTSPTAGGADGANGGANGGTNGNADGGGGGGQGTTGGGGATGGGIATTGMTMPTIINPRRRRKAKGWFCPVCRQPYTSLLRLTTAPPPPSASGIANSNTNATTTNTALSGGPNANANANGSGDGTLGVGGLSRDDGTANANNATANEGAQGGLLGSLRPVFFRSMTAGRPLTNGGGANILTSGGGTNGTAVNNGGAGGVGGAVEMNEVNVRAGDVEAVGGLGRTGA